MTEPKSPHEYPIFRRNGQAFSFFDCSCTTHCLEGSCKYCAFLEEAGACPANETD